MVCSNVVICYQKGLVIGYPLFEGQLNILACPAHIYFNLLLAGWGRLPVDGHKGSPYCKPYWF